MNGKALREIRRLISERTTLLILAGILVGAVRFCLGSSGRTASDAYVLEPAKSSAVWGALLIALLTLVQFHRDAKNHTEGIVLAYADPLAHWLRRTLALLCAAAVATLAVTAFALPFARGRMGLLFQPDAFAAAWGLIFFGALAFSVLLSAGLYLLTHSLPASFAAMLSLLLISIVLQSQYSLKPSYLLIWAQTNATNFSDLVSNRFQIDMIRWNRLFGLLTACGVWALGLACGRRYGRGLAGSLLCNARRLWLPALVVAAFSLASLCFALEPIFDDSRPVDLGTAYDSGTGAFVVTTGEAQADNPNLLLLRKRADAAIDTSSRTVSGKAAYAFENVSGGAQRLVLLLNSGCRIESASVNGAPAEAIRSGQEEGGSAPWRIDLPDAPDYTVELTYSGRIQNDGSLLQRPIHGIARDLVWLPTTGLSPSADTAVDEACSFTGSLLLDEGLEPVFMRARAEAEGAENGKARWAFAAHPGAQGTSLLAAAFKTERFEAGGLQIEFKHFQKHGEVLASLDAVRAMKACIDYFTDAFGPLPYQDRLTILELPAILSGGFASDNLSAMDETSFAEEGFLPEASRTPDSGGGLNVLVHEIAHQWWGLGTYPMAEDGTYWSAEGLTCYSTYRFMEQYMGAAYARENFRSQWEEGWATHQSAFYIQHPEILAKLSDQDASSILGGLRSIGLYDVMPLQLLKAEEAVGGPEAFQAGLRALYRTHRRALITYDDFLSALGLTREVLSLE